MTIDRENGSKGFIDLNQVRMQIEDFCDLF